MNIAFDVRAMDGPSRYRGIGICIVYILNELLPMLKDHHVTLYVYNEENLKEIDSALLKSVEIIHPKLPFIKRMRPGLQRLFSGILPREFKSINTLDKLSSQDIFFQFYHEMGVPSDFGGTAIVMAHDLIPLIFENNYFKHIRFSPNPKIAAAYTRKRLQRRAYLQGVQQFKRADIIVANSNNTKQDLMQCLDIIDDKITTIYPGVPSNPVDTVDKDFINILKRSPYITYIGGIDARRPIDQLLLQAGDIYTSQNIRTIVAGYDFEHIHKPTLKKVVEGGIKSGAIVILGHVTEAEKYALLKHAVASIYPTLYEGFGLPILESFVSNTPIITYSNSSTIEVGGNAAIFVSSLKDIPHEIAKLSKDTEYRSAITKKGKAQAQKFSWKQSATKLKDLLEAQA